MTKDQKEIRYFEHKDLSAQLHAMRKAGGQSQKAANEVFALKGRIADGDENPFEGMQRTHHGEDRIDHCVKYDLNGYRRLVVIAHKNCIYLRYAGSHDDVEKWLDSHRWLTVVMAGDGSLKELTVSKNLDDSKSRIASGQGNLTGTLLSHLEPDYRAKLLGDLPAWMTEPLRDIECGSPEDMIRARVAVISDEAKRTTVYDVLAKLLGDDISGAKDRIDLEHLPTPKLIPIDDLSEDEILHIGSGDTIRDMRIGSREYQDWINEYQKSAHEFDWFLFMHPEQEKHVAADYAGPAKLSGVSGSGKTCIAIRRAVRLADKYGDGVIAIITLNRSLSSLISRLVDHVCPPSKGRARIKVCSFFELCQELLSEFEPKNSKLYSDVTWRLEEHIDEIFREFYRCQAAYTKAEALKPLHKSLTALGIDAETYIRDEFDWIRSALPNDQRHRYSSIERSGRGYGIDKNRRGPILSGLNFWEEKMRAIGVIDYLGLATALHRHLDSLGQRYRCIIVDEAQDFGTTELSIIRRLVGPAENDLFLCGDLAQHILPKHQKFLDAGIEIGGRSHTIKRNYRNTREILRAAYDVLYSNLNQELERSGEMEILDPEYATRSASKPDVLHAGSLEEEIGYAQLLMSENTQNFKRRNSDRPHRGCIVIAGFSLYELKIFGEQVGLPVLDGTQDVSDGTLFLSDLEQTKGYEFDTVAILNCNDEVIPPAGVPIGETFRYASQLYVAMTRARDQLVLSYSTWVSKWLAGKHNCLGYESWASFYDRSDVKLCGRPGFLPDIPEAGDPDANVMNSSGGEFIYTVYSRGLPPEIQDKLEELVSGAVLRDGIRVRWDTVGQLLDDMRYRGRGGYIFGPTADKVVREALESAAAGKRLIARKPQKKIIVDFNSMPRVAAAQISVASPGRASSGTPRSSQLNLPVSALNIDIRTQECLKKIGITTVGELLRTSSLTLRRSPKFGMRRVDAIRAALEQRDFKW